MILSQEEPPNQGTERTRPCDGRLLRVVMPWETGTWPAKKPRTVAERHRAHDVVAANEVG